MMTLRPSSVALLLAVFLGLSDTSAKAEFVGGSPLYGFTFRAAGNEGWCSEVVHVDLQVSDETKFLGNQHFVEKRLRRLVVLSQRLCANMQRLEVRADLASTDDYNVEYSRKTDWQLIRKYPDTDLPQCLPSMGSQCAELTKAFAAFKTATDRPYFNSARLAKYLEREGDALDWVDGDITGSFNALPERFLAYSPHDIATSLQVGLKAECVGGAVHGYASASAQVVTLDCPDEEAKSRAVAIYTAQSMTFLVSLKSARSFESAKIYIDNLVKGPE